jgi:chromosome partitioning protein
MSEKESFDPEWIADTSEEQVPAQPQPETGRKMPLVIAIANQKGGVAKTTTVVSLGGALTNHGKEVLLIDLDAPT